MKSFDLHPTYENILTTYTNNTLSRNTEVGYFVNILYSVNGGCSIALNGKWGSGKTFFVKQCQMVVNALNDNYYIDNSEEREKIKDTWSRTTRGVPLELEPQVTVYYNAWANDNDDEPVLSLIYSVLQSTNTCIDFGKTNDFWRKTSALIDMFTGKNSSALVNALKEEDPLSRIKEQKNVHNLVSEFLEALLIEQGNRLIIFIDELDRSRPSFAVRLLERIKHYFYHDKITFVFSVNIDELQHTIKRFYGEEFSAHKYLDRFFDFRFSLPQVDMNRLFQELEPEHYSYTYYMVCTSVIKAFNFTIREASHFYTLAKASAFKPAFDENYSIPLISDRKTTQFCLLYILPIMIGLRISDLKRYNDFITGRDSSPLHEVFASDGPNHRNFDDLLDITESYAKNSMDTNDIAILREKLEKVYTAIFVEAANNTIDYSHKIGVLTFNRSTYDLLIRTESGLSEYANFNIFFPEDSKDGQNEI